MKQQNNVGKSSPLFVFNGMAMFIGSSLNTDPHKHDCLQLTVDLNGEFLMKGVDQEWMPYASSIVSSDYVHRLDSNGSQQLFIYLDKDTHHARLLEEKYLANEPIAKLDLPDGVISPDDLAKMMVNQVCVDWHHQGLGILLMSTGKQSKPKRDSRVEEAMNEIATMKFFPPDLISQLASRVCLSESRLRHVFKEHTGQSIKSFILWTKITRSLDLIMKGEKMVDASRKSGFWDGAHFDKTMHKLLGVSPGAIESFSESFEMKTCTTEDFFMTTEIMS